ncbi:hypothetical protein C5Y96_09860 [Blastopirellula marina]|uniref:Phage tail protein n=1 Tax=Blastopirellula marina TaxID=124 RepID=A0A2S8FLU9_9BACT|nr:MULTISPECIES: hypothetical protein [Pirellulaceae]PQO33155.1 hypothetical protein C5Y96_09860 [Blastopirellula marina]RCS52244.1 hypothetical protein DTL36_09870 [Bremerella cremea]
MPMTREEILAIDDTPIHEVKVANWPKPLLFRSVRADETERVYKIINGGPNKHVNLVALLCCDEEGNPLFTEDDVAELCKKSMSSVQQIMEAIVEAHPILTADTAELEKN